MCWNTTGGQRRDLLDSPLSLLYPLARRRPLGFFENNSLNRQTPGSDRVTTY